MILLLFLMPAALFAQSYSQTPHVVQNKAGASTTTAEFCLQYTDAALKCVAASTSGWVPKSGTTVDLGLTGERFRDGFFSRDLKAPTVHVTDLTPTSGSGGIISIFGELWPAGIGGEKLGSSSSIRRFSEAHITDGYFYDDVVISDALQVGGDITWASDNSGNIGASSSGRPNSIHVGTQVLVYNAGGSELRSAVGDTGLGVYPSGGGSIVGHFTTGGVLWANGGLRVGGGSYAGSTQIVNSSAQWNTDLLFSSDATYNIGNSTTNRPNNVNVARNLSVYAGSLGSPSSLAVELAGVGLSVYSSGTLYGSVDSSGYVYARTGFVVGSGGSLGQSITLTVRDAGGGADCNIVITGGIVTGGTC